MVLERARGHDEAMDGELSTGRDQEAVRAGAQELERAAAIVLERTCAAADAATLKVTLADIEETLHRLSGASTPVDYVVPPVNRQPIARRS